MGKGKLQPEMEFAFPSPRRGAARECVGSSRLISHVSDWAHCAMGPGLPSSYAGRSAPEPGAVAAHLPHCLRSGGEGDDRLSALGTRRL